MQFLTDLDIKDRVYLQYILAYFSKFNWLLVIYYLLFSDLYLMKILALGHIPR